MNLDDIYTPQELAKHLKLHYRTVLREIARGNLVAKKIGRILLISKEQVEQYLHQENIQPLRVAVAIVVSQGKVLLVKRKLEENKLKWQFPAGRVRYGEKSAVRAEIQCLQETAVHCKAVKKLGQRVHPQTKAGISYWLCEYLQGQASNVDSSENTEVRWVGLLEPEKLFTTNYYPAVKNYLRKLAK
jgi:8-oxo-dGTP diphosphatase